MPTPKFDSPPFYWIVQANELVTLADTDLDLAESLKALTFYEDVILIDVETFCADDQALYADLVLDDFYTDAYKEKLKNAVLQTVYYNLCEE